MPQKFWVKGSGEGQFLDYVEVGREKWIRIGDEEIPIDLSSSSGSPFLHLLVDGRSYPCSFREEDDVIVLLVRGSEYRFEVLSERRKRIRDLGISAGKGIRSKNITAPIPGLVVEIEVGIGDTVRAGQGIVIMEAMKMENELKSPADGEVKEIRVEKGTPVDEGELLVMIE